METKETKIDFSYQNREIEWLRFNHRVLQEAADNRNPLYERLKFLAIFSTNLDEFFQVRVSKLRQLKKVNKKVRRPLGFKPNKLLKEILAEVYVQQEQFGNIFQKEILPELRENKIYLIGLNEFSEKQKQDLRSYFVEKLSEKIKILSGLNIQAESFKEGYLYIATTDSDCDKVQFLEVPTQEFSRFIKIPSEDGKHVYTYLEDVLKLNLDQLISEEETVRTANIKISKDAELYLDDEYEGDWVEQIYQSLKRRQVGQPTRLLYEKGTDNKFRKRLRKLLNLGKVDMMAGGERHNFSDFFDFPDPLDNPNLYFKSMPPLKHKAFENARSIFDLIRQKDRLIHFPYQRFDYLENWLYEAAHDLPVTSIHISLYRIAKESKLTSALLKALENGKEVTIFVEAKARFDEANNIKWGRIFEKKGGKVFYSFPNVKVHSKILYVQRKENDGLRGYSYIGTGNFNAKTSKIYCDHALFTANKKIGRDLEQVFRVLKRELLLPKLKTLLISPFNSRISFEELIQQEIDNANKGLTAKIWAKMNSLEDKRMIDWLYRASNAGVEIRLLVRGFCCLVPQIEGQSENISVISIVDRYLEHGRVFLFHNDGNEKMFMGSADWMTRNLDKRIEVLTPILDKEVFEELTAILEIQFSDTIKARIDKSDSSNDCVESKRETDVRSQYAIYQYLKDKFTVS